MQQSSYGHGFAPVPGVNDAWAEWHDSSGSPRTGWAADGALAFAATRSGPSGSEMAAGLSPLAEGSRADRIPALDVARIAAPAGPDDGLGPVSFGAMPDPAMAARIAALHDAAAAPAGAFATVSPAAAPPLAGMAGVEAMPAVAGGAKLAGHFGGAGLDDPGGTRDFPAIGFAGSVANQANTAMQADAARSAYGVDGTGIRIGVLSDSYNTLGGAAADIASGDLPAGGVTVLDEYSGTGIDEGRAMLQLIHDVAPGAELLFHTAFESVTGFAQGIIDLADAGADIIVDDVIYLAEPMFQDGPIAQAIDEVVARGVAYFSSAGNNGRDGYESAFRGSGEYSLGAAFGELHDFDPGAGVDVTQTIYVPRGQSFTLSFQWDQPFNSFASSAGSGGSASDIDIYVLDANGTLQTAGYAAGSRSWENNLGADPLELFAFTNTTGSDYLQLVIANYDGPDPGLMRYVAFGSFTAVEYGGGGTVYGHAAAAGAQAVGAAWYGDTPAYGTSPPEIEYFSSAGTSTILFDAAGNRLASPQVRATPDITAPDGTNTTFFGADVDGDGAPNFFGTSAAAPHAAAVAALMLQLNPALSVTEIYDVLKATAIDMDDPFTPGFDTGWDAGTGYGLIQADAALAALGVGGGGGGGGAPSNPANLYVGDSGPNGMVGTAANDTIMGLAGADTLSGGNGNDSLDGGEGNDLVYGEDGVDFLQGGAGVDTLFGDNGGDWLEGGDGQDLLAGMNDDDVLFGNADTDTVYGNGGADRLYGGTGNDLMNGGSGSDLVEGGDGADSLYGLWDLDTFIRAGAAGHSFDTGSSDTLRGGGGADHVYGGTGDDWVDGGDGNDLVVGLTGNDVGQGGDGNDTVYGNAGADSLYAGGGDDLVNGGSGSDLIEGGDGADMLYGLWDLDTFLAAGADGHGFDSASSDHLRGGGGADTIYGGTGADIVEGGSDNDLLAGLTGNDTLQGGDGADSVYGNAGADRIYGGGGGDSLNGGTGADSLEGGDGDDVLVGLWDLATYIQAGALEGGYDAESSDTLAGGSGNDSLTGGSGSDRLDGGSGDDELVGLWGDDTLTGNGGSDRIYGNGGTDQLYGEDGDDWLDGGGGNDRLWGGSGADTLVGIWGEDVLTGGSGADRFVSHGADFGSHLIADFSIAEGDSLQVIGATGAISAAMGSQWVEILDDRGSRLFTLEGVVDPAGLTILV